VCNVYELFNIPIHYSVAFFVIALITLLAWEVSKWLHPFFIKRFSGDKEVIKREVLFFLSANICSIMLTSVLVTLFTVYVRKKPASIYNPIKLTITYLTLVLILFHLLNVIVFYMNRAKEKEKEALTLQKMNTLAQLQSIKSQLNPHFLFNNLNVLSSLVIRDNPEANLFIENFASVYHYVLSNQEKELTTLEKELDFLENYNFLLERRFPNSIIFNIDVPNDMLQYKVAPIAIQMLVENAIKHNVVSKNKPLEIYIGVTDDDMLKVSNLLIPKINTEAASNLGLQNIDQRYKIITGKNIQVHKTEKDFTVYIPLIKIRKHEYSYY
jgi:two-component system, LytTR family, sensor kinase